MSFNPEIMSFPGGIQEIQTRGGLFAGGSASYRTDDSGVRLDGLPVNSGQGSYLERQIVALDDAIQTEILPPDDSNALVLSVASEEPMLFHTLTYRRLESNVIAAQIGPRSNDVNTVGVNGQLYSVKVSRPAAGIFLDDSEVRVAAANGLGLQAFQTSAVVQSMVSYRRRLVFNGFAEHGQHGFFQDGVVKVDNRNVEVDVTTLTADQLYNLLMDSVSLLQVNSLDLVEPDSLIMPSIALARAVKLRMTENGATVMQTFLANNPWINSMDQISSSPFLNFRTQKIGSTTRQVMSMIAFAAGTNNIRIRQSGLRQLQPIRFLKGTLIAWEDALGDVEILRPGYFRIINFAGADPRAYTG